MRLGESVSVLKGVGDKKAKKLAKLEINTIRDLLYYVPRGYEAAGEHVQISELKEDSKYCITATISGEPKLRRIRNGITLTTFVLLDGTGSVEAVFFNQPYIRRMYKSGDAVVVSGKTKRVGRRLQFTNPSMEKHTQYVPSTGITEKTEITVEGLLPVYALTTGLTQKAMRILLKSALVQCGGMVRDVFTNAFRKTHNLCEVNYAIAQIHFPDDKESLKNAKNRLIFEELLLFNIALNMRQQADTGIANKIEVKDNVLDVFLAKLGYKPTGAQMRVIKEITADINRTKPMARMIQGDVGSGKTTPAMFALYACAKAGRQSAMMAPTEVLAKQHFLGAQKLFSDENINIELISGSTPAAQKKRIYENVASGLTDIVFGTHALLYEKMQFGMLGLVVTDEQHRFGVSQRATLETKGAAPHTLIMSATPIPRTLALVLYGETDISIIDEMPPGRKPVKTFCVRESKRADMYGFIDQHIAEGAQAFVVCPLVEQNDTLNIRSSEEVYESMRRRFGERSVSLLHGRMKPSEKNEVMQRFAQKKFAILVSTTVIEVGIDIPGATIMVIENADRFGLAQLHQLRGRVGRGRRESFCFLMGAAANNERLKILTKTNDGFKIAEEDLRLRGPGQFLGNKQSGMSDLYMANMIRDMKLLRQTQQIAKNLQSDHSELYSELMELAKSVFFEKLQKTTIN